MSAEHTSPETMYQIAYSAQYADRNMPLALMLYREILDLHPIGHEAEYSRMQIQNMASNVISAQRMCDAQTELLQNQFQRLARTELT